MNSWTQMKTRQKKFFFNLSWWNESHFLIFKTVLSPLNFTLKLHYLCVKYVQFHSYLLLICSFLELYREFTEISKKLKKFHTISLLRQRHRRQLSVPKWWHVLWRTFSIRRAIVGVSLPVVNVGEVWIETSLKIWIDERKQSLDVTDGWKVTSRLCKWLERIRAATLSFLELAAVPLLIILMLKCSNCGKVALA